ncbi:MAG TPA: cation transporter [Limnochorda sp.]|mgnify:CR=1 FL=1
MAQTQGVERRGVIQLAGLTCPSCVARIEGTVRRMAGVREARLQFASQRLVVDLAQDGPGAAEVAERVRELGYTVVSAQEEPR